MKYALFGAGLCVAAILLLQRQQLALGLFLFIVGIVLMYGGRWRKP